MNTIHRCLDIKSDSAISPKRSRTAVDRFETDSFDNETCCENDGSIQTTGNKGDKYGEIIGKRLIMPHSWFFSLDSENCLQSICN